MPCRRANADRVVASTASVPRWPAARVSEFVPAASCTTCRVASPARPDNAWRTGCIDTPSTARVDRFAVSFSKAGADGSKQ